MDTRDVGRREKQWKRRGSKNAENESCKSAGSSVPAVSTGQKKETDVGVRAKER